MYSITSKSTYFIKTKISIVILTLFMVACHPAKNNYMLLKASNNMYIVMGADSVLIANEPDASKAEVFEEVCDENGKAALKTSKGKFVSDDRGRGNLLVANRNAIGEWEQFEILKVSDERVTIKSSANKYVCADMGNKNVLFANRDQAGEWEAFALEKK